MKPEFLMLCVPTNAFFRITWPSFCLFENGELRWRAEVEAYMLTVAMGAFVQSQHGKNVCKNPF